MALIFWMVTVPRVDLQDIVDMSRKYNLFLKVCAHGCIPFNEEPHAFYN